MIFVGGKCCVNLVVSSIVGILSVVIIFIISLGKFFGNFSLFIMYKGMDDKYMILFVILVSMVNLIS